MMNKKQRLELTWIGKDIRPKLEPRILLEDPEISYHMEPGSPFGSSIQSLVTYLRYTHAIGYERLSGILAEVFGLSISEGAISQQFTRKINQNFEFNVTSTGWCPVTKTLWRADG